ncbi:hypothetical protein Mgra_00005762 [Meloidogyne graminicola]|uniref:SPRY domain-containing protein n=1 Tax=Meloidogyne graminicola TaxID=189291 RepID=A0A8S9ZN75_9BILA|nr:hypothetical protein Mgra_00005762 [Meloidogyne graminicola]
MKKTSIDFNKRIDSLTFEFGKLTNFNFKRVFFIPISNKWKGIDSDWNPCCPSKCVRTNTPRNFCTKGNGFIRLINDTTLNYNECKEHGENKLSFVYPETYYTKPDSCIYTLSYYEIKCKKEKQNNWWLEIGVHIKDMFIRLRANESLIMYGHCPHLYEYQINDGRKIKLENFCWGDEDIFGCGVIWPPKTMNGKLPYLFFTQNGKQIGKALVLNDNTSFHKYGPYVSLKCCSIETNFGNELNIIPFTFDIENKYAIDDLLKL